jgi:hypothetical protein
MFEFVSLLFGLANFFLVIGHSTLLYFKTEECKDLPSIPLIEAIFPWPTKGKFVSILCLALSVMWLFLVCLVLMFERLKTGTFPSFMSMFSFEVLFGFCILPNTCYALYLFNRMCKQSGRWLFVPLHATQKEFQRPIMIVASLSFLSMFIKFN